MGQALKALVVADAIPVYRDDVLLGFSVIALELRRIPIKAVAAVKVAKIPAVFRRTRAATEMQLLLVLRQASKAGERLGFSEICGRAGVARSTGTRDILAGLCDQGLVHSAHGLMEIFGRGHGTVYWADE